MSELSFPRLLSFVEGLDLLVIDEAQRIPGIGRVMKIWTDQVPGLKILVTGSSSFELTGQVGEPLTGRKRTLVLFPVSMFELAKERSAYELSAILEEYILYGTYPVLLSVSGGASKREILEELVGSYLLKDVLELDRIRSSKITRKNKYYFHDTGIRNALIANFNPLERRDDLGALWENFLVSERLKTRAYAGISANPYFWRTWDQKEKT